jgi:YVTN family beta-propeller protein
MHPRTRRFWAVTISFVFCASPGHSLYADELDHLRVGLQPDGRIVVPTNQILKPAGTQVTFPGRPVDLALCENGKTLVAKSTNSLVFIDIATAKVKQTLRISLNPNSKLGFSVVGLLVDGDTIYASDSEDHIQVAQRQEGGKYRWKDQFTLAKPQVGGFAHPAGIARVGNDELWVASTRGNNVQRMNLATGEVKQVIPVGVAPYMICASTHRVYVSNWGGDPPRDGQAQGKSSKTPVRIDPKTGVANHGSVSVLGKEGNEWKQMKTIEVGVHPCAMALSPKRPGGGNQEPTVLQGHTYLYVANANSDTVSVIRTTDNDRVVETISCRPEGRLPFGSGCNALALNGGGNLLYVANGTNNCVAVVPLSAFSHNLVTGQFPARSEVQGLIPCGWYPGALQFCEEEGRKLFVGNIKGHGSVSQPRPFAKGKKSKDFLGSVSIIDIPGPDALAEYTEGVNRNNRLTYSLVGLAKPRAEAPAVPVPQRHGERSIFKHVIYVIKENRTYDQVLGDMKEGNGDPNLVMFGQNVTPNHHALAREFTLFDNFYCSGVISADGHSWCNEAYVTDYLERAFGGFTRSYPDDGSDPLAYPTSGFLWDNALARKKSLRVYGEFVTLDFYPKKATWTDYYNDFKSGAGKIPINVKSNLHTLQPYTHRHYPWFPLLVPDTYRASIFLDEFREFEKKGELPNLIYLTLPCNHTNGTKPGFPTPRAMVADNDLALGQIVDAVSRSKFWRDTCIFVVEDDPQDGFDHVDGHRTVALAISPYTRRHFVDHTAYNQTGMVKTIELILGLPPMNQLDLSATAMRNCFQAQPDLTPYRCIENRIALNEMNPPLNRLKGAALHWARKSLALNFDKGDEADEDTLNRILWHSTRGGAPYPERYAGQKED